MKFRPIFVGLSFLLCLGLVGAFTGATSARASTTITVNTTVDELNSDGDCSLREAIRAANLDTAIDACPAGSGADTIIVPSGTYDLTNSGANEDEALTGDLDITSAATISGTGAANTIISGSGIDRVLHVVTGTVTISSVTIQQGNSGLTRGGGIYNLGSLTLISSVVMSSTSRNDGGGIYNSNGTLLLLGSTVIGNNATSSSGGGIFNGGSLTLTASLVVNNTALSAGGISSSDKLAVISGVIVSNTGQFNGGGIYNSGTMTLTASHIAGNTILDGNGGGIVNDGALIISSSAIVSNATGSAFTPGGGIANRGVMTLTDSTVGGNFAGGVLNASENGKLTIINAVISNNSGRGVHNIDGTTIITGSTIANNLSGGGISNGVSTGTLGIVTVTNSTISGNDSPSVGGGIYNGLGGRMAVSNSTISGNTAGSDGGGIYISPVPVFFINELNLNNVTIANNTADNDNDGTGDGGGIRNISGTVKVNNAIIAGNLDNGPITATIHPDASGTFVSGGYNLIGVISGTIGFTATGDITNTAPLLSLLQDNGGPTLTHALLPGSPAIDGGNPAGCTDNLGHPLSMDQRGFFRGVDGDGNGSAICDIGAYEFGSIIAMAWLYLPLILK